MITMQCILIKCTKIIVCLMSNWPTNENCVILNYGHYHTIFDRCQKRAERSFCVTCPAASRHFVFQSISMFLALRQYNLAKCKTNGGIVKTREVWNGYDPIQPKPHPFFHSSATKALFTIALKEGNITWWNTRTGWWSVDLPISLHNWWSVVRVIVRNYFLVNCSCNQTD